MKAIGGLKELLIHLSRVDDEAIVKVIFSTFTIDLKWFYKSVYRKISNVHPDKLLVLFGNGDGNFINYEIAVLGKFRKFVFVKGAQGIFHPKFIYVELKDKFYFGLGSSNLVSGSYNSFNLEFQQIFELNRSEVKSIQSILANFIDEVSEVVPTSQVEVLKEDFKDWPRNVEFSLTQKIFPSSPRFPLIETIRRFHEADPLVEAWCLSPFLSNREVLNEDLKNSIARDRSLLSKLFSLGVKKISIYTRSVPTISKAYPEVEYYVGETIKNNRKFHAKACVFRTLSGKFLVVWGSSNFTDSAWFGRNFEIDYIEVLNENPFKDFLKEFFFKVNPVLSSFGKGEDDEEEIFINSCHMDCDSKILTIELSKFSPLLDISIRIKSGNREIVPQNSLKKSINRIKIDPFVLKDWLNAPRAEVFLYVKGVLHQQIYPFLIGIPEMYFNEENGEFRLPTTMIDHLDMLVHGRYVPTYGGDNIDESEENEEVLIEESEVTASNLDNHMGLSDTIAKYLSAIFTDLFLNKEDADKLKSIEARVEEVIKYFCGRMKSPEVSDYEKRFMDFFIQSYRDLKINFDGLRKN